MTEARFAGTDPRLLRVAAALGVDLAGLDTHTLPAAVADAVEARGLPDSPDARGLVADLLRGEAADWAEWAKRRRPEPKAKGHKRTRLELLRAELHRWLIDEQTRHPGARIVPRKMAVDDAGKLILDANECDGVEPLARRMAAASGTEPDTLEKWLYENHEAKAMLASFRPVRLPD